MESFIEKMVLLLYTNQDVSHTTYTESIYLAKKNTVQKYLTFAKQEILSHDFGKATNWHCAVLVRGGSILTTGFNSFQVNSKVRYYTDCVADDPEIYTRHAEMDAVFKARKMGDLSNAKVYVARVRRDTLELSFSRPCEICQHVLARFGLKRAVYSIDENEYGVLKL